MGYPPEVLQRVFDRSFAIRGLHFDTRTGYLLKLDQFSKIQTGCVYLGRTPVSVVDVVDAYKGVSITSDYHKKHLHQLVDLFALSETTLLADCTQTFMDLQLDYSPDYIAKDIRRAIEHVHVSGVFHRSIMAAPSRFLDPAPLVGEYLLRLRDAGRFTFLLTNSPFAFVDAGMRYMLAGIEKNPLGVKFGLKSSADWTHLFDVTITSARKPNWFVRDGHFRRVDTSSPLPDAQAAGAAAAAAATAPDTPCPPSSSLGGGTLSWKHVDRFERGAVYTEGSLAEFTRLISLERQSTQQQQQQQQGGQSSPQAPSSAGMLRGHEILYMGDHVAADLTSPWLTARWRTVAIVREIRHETAVQASREFKEALAQLLRIEALIDYGQRIADPETKTRLRELKKQRQAIKHVLLRMFNPHFGSVFRTSSHRTEFFSDVGKYADVYAASVTNFLNYSLDHTFYSSRIFFPHEKTYKAS